MHRLRWPTEESGKYTRVMFNTGVIFFTPWFSGPMRLVVVPLSASSAVGTMCVPILFLSLRTWILLLVPDVDEGEVDEEE